MRFSLIMSQLLVLAALGLLFYDLVYQWVVNMQFKVRNVEEVWSAASKPGFEQGQHFMKAVFPASACTAFAHLPAPVVIVATALFFYAVYRFLLFVGGESRSARL